MEPMEVIDLSSDDEKSPSNKRDITSFVITNRKEKAKNNDKNANSGDVAIVRNVARNHKRAMHRSNESCLNTKKIKFSKEEDNSRLVKSLLNQKDISIHKLNRIKPETLLTQCTLKFPASEVSNKTYDTKHSPTKNGDSPSLKNNNLSSKENLKLPRHENGKHSFKVNEGASSSKQPPRLTEKNRIKMSETSELTLSPSAEMIESFFDACRGQDSSKDMEKIIGKLKKRFNNLQPSYAKSGSFMQLIRQKKDLIVNNRLKLFLHISEVMDEMKARQIQNKPFVENKNNCYIEEPETSAEGKLGKVPEKDNDMLMVEDPKDMERLLFLEKAMRRCERYINKCEQAEVNFDDENDSHYIMAEKYKYRMVELYNKYCAITGERADAARPYLRPKHLSVTPLPSLNNAITSFINMKITKVNKSLASMKKRGGQIRFTDALIFPDYVDILNCVKKCNEEQNLQLNKLKQESIAKEAFLELGRHLKRCRQADYYDTFSLYLEQEDCDPASKDKDLNEILTRNQEIGEKKMQQVLQEFVEKQNAVKATENESCLEKEGGEEIANESSEDTDDESSHLSEIGEEEVSDSNENKANDVSAEQQDVSNRDDSDIIELDKPYDDLEPKAEADLEIDKLADDLDSKSCYDVKLNEPQKNSDKKVDDHTEPDNQQCKINCKVNDDVKVDNPQDNLNQEDTADVDVNKSEDDLEEISNDAAELGTVCANVEKEGATIGDLHDELNSILIETIYETTVAIDANESGTDVKIDGVDMTEKNNTEMMLKENSAQETEISDITIERIVIDSKTEVATELSSTTENARPEITIRQVTGSTIATCEVDLVQEAETPETNLIDECSPVIPVNNAKVIDAPPVATTVELIPKEEEKKPILRVRQFARPPGSWKDYQSPTKSLSLKTDTAETAVSNTEVKERSKTLPVENQQSESIKLTNPIAIGKSVPVDNGFLINLKNHKSTVMIPTKANKPMPQINLKTVMNNVTFNIHNQVQSQPKVKSTVSHGSRPAQNLVNIHGSGKINAIRANIRITNNNSGEGRMPPKSNTVQTAETQRQKTSTIVRPAGHVRLVSPSNNVIAPQNRCQIVPMKRGYNQERTIVRHIAPVTDVNGKKTIYRLVKRSPRGKHNIVVSTEGGAVAQNRIVRSSIQRTNSNSNSSTVVSLNSKLEVSDSIMKISPVKAPRQNSNRVDTVYETTSDNVPIYVIE